MQSINLLVGEAGRGSGKLSGNKSVVGYISEIANKPVYITMLNILSANIIF